MKFFVKWCAVTILYSFVIIAAECQSTVQVNAKFINRLISATPNFSGGGTFGFMQEWCSYNKHFSINFSGDYETRINIFHTTRIRYNAYYFRPGIRYYYKKNNTGFFHGASVLVAYEKYPMPWKSALGFAPGLSYVGYRYVFKNGIILEADGFAGFGMAHITEYNNDQFLQERYYFISNIRIGYRFNTKH
ncbi:MAG: hypothetical protein KF845_16125 [Cyclobacteriaceae bacterium]|nr:hypothetical protein [Cyclobacteriaceae bacterium]